MGGLQLPQQPLDCTEKKQESLSSCVERLDSVITDCGIGDLISSLCGGLSGRPLSVAICAAYDEPLHWVAPLVRVLQQVPVVSHLYRILPQGVSREGKFGWLKSYYRSKATNKINQSVQHLIWQSGVPEISDSANLWQGVPLLGESDNQSINVVLCYGAAIAPSWVKGLHDVSVLRIAWSAAESEGGLVVGDGVQSVELRRLLGDIDEVVVDRIVFSIEQRASAAINAIAPRIGGLVVVVRYLASLSELDVAIQNNSLEIALMQTEGGGTKSSELVGVRSYFRAEVDRLVTRIQWRGKALWWRIGLRQRLADSPLPQRDGLDGFLWQDAPPGHFWADPFFFESNGVTWLFFEDFDAAKGYAVLSVAEVLSGGSLGAVQMVMDLGLHLSYPHVFKVDGEIYMIPESSAAGTVNLWRATDFPTKWEKVCSLLKLKAVDTTVFLFRDEWWMLTSPLLGWGHAPITLLYRANSIIGPWSLHRQGIVASDVRNSRCAGAVFQDGERLIRPSQDCSGMYGRALVFNEIVACNEIEYSERILQRVEATIPGLHGVHTYARCAAWEAIDGRWLVDRHLTWV